jgi:signal transduction histidine kinase
MLPEREDMKHSKQSFRASAIPDTTVRRLRTTPGYFFIIWRWSMWLYALIVIAFYHSPNITPALIRTNTILLIITFLQSLIATLYTPLIRFLPSRVLRIFRLRRKPPPVRSEEEGPEIITPLAQMRNPYWNVLIYGADLVICGLTMYFSGPFGSPPYGNGSPFYRYGLSTVFATAMSYRYAGGLAAALGYDLFFFIALLFPAPGSPHPFPVPTVVDVIGSLIDAPLAAILAAYFTTLVSNYAQSKRREQANVRSQRALLSVSETILSVARDRSHLLQCVAEQLRQGGHFQRLVIALIKDTLAPETPMDAGEESTRIVVEANVPDIALPQRTPTYIDQVMRTGQKLSSFEYFNRAQYGGYGIARLYLPIPRDEQIQMVIGVESSRQRPFDSKREEFLMIAGRQLLVALDNLRLTEQAVQLAAEAERGRIAREIHDGIAQLIYMLSLNAETCATQAHRIAEASEEVDELIAPLAGHLDRLVTISKQALWETRNYMFSLKPLMSGDTTLSQMLQNQVQEFQTISNLPVTLHIEGVEPAIDGDQARAHRYTQVGTALFRLVQEALTNAYKHAQATQLQVHLHYRPDTIEVTISDNGHGLPEKSEKKEQEQRLYSGRGLHGMYERAEELGGTLCLIPQQAGGMQVQVSIPLFYREEKGSKG